MENLDTTPHSADRELDLNEAIAQAQRSIITDQHDNGYWFYELEADCTIPAEYIMMMHFMGDIDHDLQQKIAVYLRRRQNKDGGWPLFYGGEADLSCTVKAYYALKMAGDDTNAAHMTKARETVLSMGGAAKANVFTRIALALFEQLPWRGVPFIPVEIMTLPKWFPFHLSKVSYWSRTVMVPLFILCTLKAKAKNPQNVAVQELFVTPPEHEKKYFKMRSRLNKCIFYLERLGMKIEPIIPEKSRAYALKKAEKWFTKRLNGTDGLGAIFPAMVNAYEALDILGYPEDHPHRLTAKKALEKMLVIKDDEAYCQPCLSPVWDTLLAAGAFEVAGGSEPESAEALTAAADWLIENQLKDEPGDWRDDHPNLEGGGWPFQFNNDYYPDLDDTAFAAYILQKIDSEKYRENILRAARWLKGMQSSNGGFAAFDADNTYYYMNEIPFADHGALLDPPTADVSARCIMLFGLLAEKYPEFREPTNRSIDYLLEQQEADGSWFGRWGTNYIYGTWSALMALEEAGISSQERRIQKAVTWLKNKQRPDGGWGEDNWSYHDPETRGEGDRSTSFQTAWALLGLMSAGEADSEAVKNGIDYLISSSNGNGLWDDPEFTAPGFPKVFYLKYHGYSKYFPLWALARYRNEAKSDPINRPVKNKVGFVVAMPQELKTLGNIAPRKHAVVHHSENVLVCLSGVGPKNATKATRMLLDNGVTMLVSWGTAAALSSGIPPGTVNIPEKIITTTGETIPTDSTLRKAIINQIPLNGSLRSTSLCETTSLLVDKKDKISLSKRTGAEIADMESGAVAGLAQKKGIPFVAIRSVSDSAGVTIPPTVQRNLSDGILDRSAIFAQALRRPQDWLPLLKLAVGFNNAQKSLRKVSETVLPYLNKNVDNIESINA